MVIILVSKRVDLRHFKPEYVQTSTEYPTKYLSLSRRLYVTLFSMKNVLPIQVEISTVTKLHSHV